MNIISDRTPPEQCRRIAYFEIWDGNRPCLHMTVNDVPSNFIHIHIAFPQITADYDFNITGMEDESERPEEGIKDIKCIVSFGCWAFYTEAPAYNGFDAGTLTGSTRLPLVFQESLLATLKQEINTEFFMQTIKRRLQKQTVSIVTPVSCFCLFPIDGFKDRVLLYNQCSETKKRCSIRCFH